MRGLGWPATQAQGAHATADALEWVVSGYALTFGLALGPAGRLGDRLGYKRLFLTGLSLFVVASVARRSSAAGQAGQGRAGRGPAGREASTRRPKVAGPGQ